MVDLSVVMALPDNLSDEQLEEIRHIFSLYDKDNNGTITANEMGTVMRALGQNPTEAEIEALINVGDADRNHSISFNEFVFMLKKTMERPIQEKELRAAFRLFDKDGNGLISAHELQNIMQSLGETLNDEECEEMLREADVNEDGFVNYEEFVRTMTGK